METVQSKPYSFAPEHLKYLTDRAIDPQLAYAEGVRSLDEASARSVTENPILIGGGLAFPYDHRGLPPDFPRPCYTRVQLDDREANGAKSNVVSGITPPPYLLSSTSDTVSPIYIVEAPAKALALASHGWADAMALGGVSAGFFLKGSKSLQPQLLRFFPRGREVFICFDAGRAMNPKVAGAEAKIARCLLDYGCTVRLVELPLHEGADQGPDDYLARFGRDAFAKLVQAARLADPVEYAKAVALDPPRARTLLEDLTFCSSVAVCGPAVRKEIAKALSHYHEPKAVLNAYPDHPIVRAYKAKAQKPGPVIGSGQPWEKQFVRTSTGEIDSCTANVSLVLENDMRWAGIIAFNSLLNDIVFVESLFATVAPNFLRHAPGSRWVDEDDVSLSVWLHRELGIDFAFQKVRSIVTLAARRHEFCPIQQKLSGLTWDDKPRVETWLHRYLGVPDTAYARKAGACWLVSAVARIFEPGCQVDYVLVLEGPQRTGKSTAIQELAMSLEFYTDQIRDVGAAECEKLLEGKWIIELGELAATVRADLEKMKAFITSRTSRYRPSYGRSVRDYPRRCIFIGTVNPVSGHGYLKDPTGNMRFWPVQTGVAHPIDRAAIRADAAQIWAEAVHLYQAGYRWYPSLAEMESLFVPEQEQRREVDPWEAPIRRYLRNEVPEEVDRKTKNGIEKLPGYVTTETLMKDAVGLQTERHDALAQKRVAQVMHTLGWETARVRDNDSRFRAWVRTERAEGPGAQAGVDRASVPATVAYDEEVPLPDGSRVRLLS